MRIELAKRTYAVSDSLFRRMSIEKYLATQNLALFSKIIASLMKHKYLESSHMPTTRTTGILDLAKRLEDGSFE